MEMVLFPALHRAGLIEALDWLVGLVDTPTRFRPFTGPASLKRVGVPGRGDGRAGFRPFTGPASLKRHGPRAAAVDRAVGFRPFTGPASLKRVEEVATVDAHDVSGPSQGRPH